MNFFKKIKPKTAIFGALIGVINGLLGAGGGMIAVPLLKNMGFSQKSAQQNALAIILPVCIFNSSLYLLRGYVKISDALPYIPGGILGALIGTFLIRKISPSLLKKLFAAFMIYAGVRLLMK